jgi:hypothetical protein
LQWKDDGVATDESPVREFQRKTFDLLIREAERAQSEGKTEDFRAVMDQITLQLKAGTIAASAEDMTYERRRERRLDRARLLLAAALLIGLIIIIVVAVMVKSEAVPYVSLLSGLTGISLGWVFGAGTVQNVVKGSETPGQPRRPESPG